MTTNEAMNRRKDEDFLGEFFAAAREDAPAVPEALMARVLADADRLQPHAAARLPDSRAQARPSVLRWLARALRPSAGLGQLTAFAAAAVAGVWLGFVQPVSLGVAASVDADFAETLELLPDTMDIWGQDLASDFAAEN